jgi:hypothetical protein
MENIMDEEVIKYYLYKNDERVMDSGFNKLDEAIEYARENNCDEVEMAAWDNRNDYNKRLEANRFKVVWQKD